MHTRTPISTPTHTHRNTKRNTDTRWEFNLCSPLSSLMSFYAISLTGIIKDRKRRANYYAANVGLLLSSCYPSIPPSLYYSLNPFPPPPYALQGTRRIVKAFREARLVSDLSFGIKRRIILHLAKTGIWKGVRECSEVGGRGFG